MRTTDFQAVLRLQQDLSDSLIPLLVAHEKLTAFVKTQKHNQTNAHRLQLRLETMLEEICGTVVERIDTEYK